MFGFTTFNQSPFNSLGGTSYLVDVAESATFTDAFASQIAFNILQAESFALADGDGGGTSFDFRVTAAENFSIEDIPRGTWGTYASQTDSFTLTATDDGFANFNPTVAESATFTATQSATATFKPTTAETATFTDSQSGRVDFAPRVAEAFTITTSINGQVAFAPIVNELFTITALEASQVDFRPTQAELVTFVEGFIVRGWFAINDSDTITWNNINNTGGGSWNTVNDTQDPGWTDIDNYQG